MKLSTRLYISHTLLVVVTTVIVGLFARFGLERLIVPSELNKIQVRAQQSGTDLSNEIGHTSQMVKALKSSPPIQATIRARANGGIDPESGLSEKYWKEQLATIFQAHMHSNPDYLQIRFIGVAAEGMEIVRVDKGDPMVWQEWFRMKNCFLKVIVIIFNKRSLNQSRKFIFPGSSSTGKITR